MEGVQQRVCQTCCAPEEREGAWAQAPSQVSLCTSTGAPARYCQCPLIVLLLITAPLLAFAQGYELLVFGPDIVCSGSNDFVIDALLDDVSCPACRACNDEQRCKHGSWN